VNASRFTYLLGIYGIQAFALYYVRDVLRAPDPAAATGNLLAAIALNLMLFAFIGGWLTDRLGPRRVQIVAGLVSALGCGLLLAARTSGLLLVFGSVLGLGIGLFLTSNWALANRVMPAGEAGKYLGLTNLATAGAGALVRLEGPAIDALNAAAPGAFWGYSLLFGFGVVVTLISTLVVPRE
jgi:MFS family permease